MQVEHLSNTRKWLLDYPVFHIDLEDTLTFVKDVSNNIVNNKEILKLSEEEIEIKKDNKCFTFLNVDLYLYLS